MSLSLPTILCSLFSLSLSPPWNSWTTTMVAGNHARRTFSYLLWHGPEWGRSPKVRKCFGSMTYHLPIRYPLCPFYGHLSNLWLSLCAEWASRARPSSLQSWVYTSSFSLGNRQSRTIDSGTHHNRTYDTIDDLVSAPPKFPRQSSPYMDPSPSANLPLIFNIVNSETTLLASSN